jgi:Tfp pilus assembly protein PilF
MDSSRVQAMIDEATAALQVGDFVRALAVADQLAAEWPENSRGRAIRARALLASGNGEEAFQEARLAVELAPADAPSQAVLAHAAWQTQRLSLAQTSFEKAVHLSERNATFLQEFAWFMASERGPRLAEKIVRQALAADERSATAWAALGLCQFRAHQRSEAETSLRRALELNPRDVYARSVMAALLQERGKNRKAEALADMLEDHPGTEEFVESVRQEAKTREIAGKLLERRIEFVDRLPAKRSYFWLGTAATAAGIALILYLGHPENPGLILLCVLVPLLLIYGLWRILS